MLNKRGNKGALTVKASRGPTEDEKKGIQELLNKKIEENVEILIHELDRSEAEKRWGDDIYDLFPLPKSVTKLFVLEIPDWNVNCRREKHLKYTGELGGVIIKKFRFRENKGLLEVSFIVT